MRLRFLHIFFFIFTCSVSSQMPAPHVCASSSILLYLSCPTSWERSTISGPYFCASYKYSFRLIFSLTCWRKSRMSGPYFWASSTYLLASFSSSSPSNFLLNFFNFSAVQVGFVQAGILKTPNPTWTLTLKPYQNSKTKTYLNSKTKTLPDPKPKTLTKP